MGKSESELYELVRETLKDALDELWDKLTPEERRIVFPDLVTEFVENNY